MPRKKIIKIPTKKATTKKVVVKKATTKKKVVKTPIKKVAKKPVKKVTPKVVKKPTSGKSVVNEDNKKKKKKNKFNLLRGMHDLLPREEKYWRPFREVAVNLADHFRFKRIDTPVLEDSNLFIRSVGKGTDIVDKEMYVFDDRDGKKICLRPEMTASVVRAYIMHGMWNMPQPLKLWYWGPMFRHDRPQAGRYRQFNQVGFEVLGSEDPVVDAELILVAYNFYNDLGLPTQIKINSIGTLAEREKYQIALVEYYRSKRSYLCEDCRKRINKNPLRLLDCKQAQCQVVKEEAPQIIEWLENDSKNHFTKVLEYLDELDIPYVLDHTLVRGLDYYVRTVFELYPINENQELAQGALGGGGRYDPLIEQMGGKPSFGAGFSLGIERASSYLKKCCEDQICQLSKPKYDAFVAQLGEQARRKALKIINDLKKVDIKIDYNLTKKSLKGQLDSANGLKVPYTLILGQKEVQDNTIIIRDMESGVQEIVNQNSIEKVMRKKIDRIDLKKKK